MISDDYLVEKMAQRSADLLAGSSAGKMDNLMAGPSADSKADKMEKKMAADSVYHLAESTVVLMAHHLVSSMDKKMAE